MFSYLSPLLSRPLNPDNLIITVGYTQTKGRRFGSKVAQDMVYDKNAHQIS